MIDRMGSRFTNMDPGTATVLGFECEALLLMVASARKHAERIHGQIREQHYVTDEFKSVMAELVAMTQRADDLYRVFASDDTHEPLASLLNVNALVADALTSAQLVLRDVDRDQDGAVNAFMDAFYAEQSASVMTIG